MHFCLVYCHSVDTLKAQNIGNTSYKALKLSSKASPSFRTTYNNDAVPLSYHRTKIGTQIITVHTRRSLSAPKSIKNSILRNKDSLVLEYANQCL